MSNGGTFLSQVDENARKAGSRAHYVSVSLKAFVSARASARARAWQHTLERKLRLAEAACEALLSALHARFAFVWVGDRFEISTQNVRWIPIQGRGFEPRRMVRRVEKRTYVTTARDCVSLPFYVYVCVCTSMCWYMCTCMSVREGEREEANEENDIDGKSERQLGEGKRETEGDGGYRARCGQSEVVKLEWGQFEIVSGPSEAQSAAIGGPTITRRIICPSTRRILQIRQRTKANGLAATKILNSKRHYVASRMVIGWVRFESI